jgi:hypothetical protein
MSFRTYEPYRAAEASEWRRTRDRLFAWARSRPSESWAFFAAGVALGAILL